MSTALITELINLVREKFRDRNAPLIKDVVIGLGFTCVELENGVMGLSYTTRQAVLDDCCQFIDAPGTLTDANILELLECAKSNSVIERVIGIASINALSQTIIREEKYKMVTTKFLELLSLGQSDTVVMVGNIKPVVEYLRANTKKMVVVDDNPLLKEIREYEITADINRLTEADVAIITSSAVIVDDIDYILTLAQNARHISLVGPTGGWLPEPFFKKNVDIVAGSAVIDVKKTKRVIKEGGGAKQFRPFVKQYSFLKSDFPT